MVGYLTRGVLFVHSAPRALCPQIEWITAGVVGVPVRFDWAPQPAARGLSRGEYVWEGEQGTAAAIASALRGLPQLRFEVTEEPSPGVDGGRWSHTPELGIFHVVTDVHGNALIPEDRIRAALETDRRSMLEALDLALGTAWDEELEPFRYAGGGAPVRWLSRAG